METNSSKTYEIGFSKDKNVSDQELKKFVVAVNANITAVGEGIVKLLKKQDLNASFKENTITVNLPSGEAQVNLNPIEDTLADPPHKSNLEVTVTGSTADIAPIIQAITGFFSNWRAVTGLLAIAFALRYGDRIVGKVIKK